MAKQQTECAITSCTAAHATGGVAGPAGTQRHDLIVVASLISKVPNLGGLARTAEVLGAGALVIGDKRLATEAAFTRWGGGLTCLLSLGALRN